MGAKNLRLPITHQYVDMGNKHEYFIQDMIRHNVYIMVGVPVLRPYIKLGLQAPTTLLT